MPSGIDYDVMHTMFESGDAAMIITGPWAIPRIEESGVSFRSGWLAFAGPGGVGKPFLGVQGFMVSAFSENKILAEAFLFRICRHSSRPCSRSIAPIPGRRRMLEAREGLEDEIMLGFVAAGSEGLAMPAIPEMSAVWSAWGNAMQLVRTGESSAEEAFGIAGEQIRALIAGGRISCA